MHLVGLSTNSSVSGGNILVRIIAKHTVNKLNVLTFNLISLPIIDFPSGPNMSAEPNPAQMFVANRYKALDYVFEVSFICMLYTCCVTQLSALFSFSLGRFISLPCLHCKTI